MLDLLEKQTDIQSDIKNNFKNVQSTIQYRKYKTEQQIQVIENYGHFITLELLVNRGEFQFKKK